MLSIRLQRLGRKGYPVYRIVVQDGRQSPDSGKYVALLGSYNPHTKEITLDKEKAEFYLKNGAQPSDRVVSLFKTQKVSLPSWVKEPAKQERKLRNPEKLRKNRSEEPAAEESAEQPEGEAEPASEEAPAEKVEASQDEGNAEEAATESEEAVEPAAETQEAPAEDQTEPEQTEEK